MSLRQCPTSSHVPIVPLSELGSGQRALVIERLLCGDDRRLLSAMGLGDQCVVRVCRSGEPCIVEVQETRLGMSRAIANKVMVLPHDEAEGYGDTT